MKLAWIAIVAMVGLSACSPTHENSTTFDEAKETPFTGFWKSHYEAKSPGFSYEWLVQVKKDGTALATDIIDGECLPQQKMGTVDPGGKVTFLDSYLKSIFVTEYQEEWTLTDEKMEIEAKMQSRSVDQAPKAPISKEEFRYSKISAREYKSTIQKCRDKAREKHILNKENSK